MHPLTVIVTALSAGAVARQSTADQPVSDAYQALDELLVRHDTSLRPALDALANDPNSPDARQLVQQALTQREPQPDQLIKILTQALVLLNAVQTHAPATAGMIGVNLAGISAAGDIVIRDIHLTYNTLMASPPVPPPPFQSPPLAQEHVLRPQELEQINQILLSPSGQLLRKTVGLHGIGGVGKTTLARLFCAQPEVQRACTDGILWVPLGKNPPEPRAQLVDLVTALSGTCNGCATLLGAQNQLKAALARRTILLVLDDVWDDGHLRPFLDASPDCARLIITRNTFTLPYDSIAVELGVMDPAAARSLLGTGLPQGHETALDGLAANLGYWPVLLRLANRSLLQRIRFQNSAPAKAIAAAQALFSKSMLIFDMSNPSERDQAVAATVEASLDLLEASERQRYRELAIFPQGVPIPLAAAAQLWQLTAQIDANQTENLVSSRLAPLSLLDYDGDTATFSLHDVLRSYLDATLTEKASLHLRLAEQWGDRPTATDPYAWRWLAYHRARAAQTSPQPQRHALTEHLVNLVDDPGQQWQQAHIAVLNDLPALRDALAQALEASVDDDDPLGIALLVRAADALVQFRRQNLRPEPIFDLALQGDLEQAQRRVDLFAIDDHWRHALLLIVAWLAPKPKQLQAQALCAQVAAELGPHQALHDLLGWVQAGLGVTQAAPTFPFPVLPAEADEALVEELVKRAGGWEYDRELIYDRGLDPDVQNPDMPPPMTRPQPTRGILLGNAANDAADDTAAGARSTTRYLAELDGPYLITYAAQEPIRGMELLQEYLSVYTNYNYPEYRYSTLWLLLGFIVQYPDKDNSKWVQEAMIHILSAALGGASVEFEQGVPIAVKALRAQTGDMAARQAFMQQAQVLRDEAVALMPGQGPRVGSAAALISPPPDTMVPEPGKERRESSDIWAHHKRRMLAHAQALGWLLNEGELAANVLDDALALAESGFAGYQAPACLALAEAISVCLQAAKQIDNGMMNDEAIDEALELAQQAAHNVQDPSFCARMTARVNAMRYSWWSPFDWQERGRHLPDAAHLREFAALHRIGHEYLGRRSDALPLPKWAMDASTFDDLVRLYQRPKADFLYLNGEERTLQQGEEVAVPDPGFLPHLAARLAAEVLASAGKGAMTPERVHWLRTLVPYALPSPTALDAVLTRLVLAQGRRATPPTSNELDALEQALALRPLSQSQAPQTELRARLPS